MTSPLTPEELEKAAFSAGELACQGAFSKERQGLSWLQEFIDVFKAGYALAEKRIKELEVRYNAELERNSALQVDLMIARKRVEPSQSKAAEDYMKLKARCERYREVILACAEHINRCHDAFRRPESDSGIIWRKARAALEGDGEGK